MKDFYSADLSLKARLNQETPTSICTTIFSAGQAAGSIDLSPSCSSFSLGMKRTGRARTENGIFQKPWPITFN